MVLHLTFCFVDTGHMAEFFQTESGYVDLKWQKEFGGIVRMKGPFGVGIRSLSTTETVANRPHISGGSSYDIRC